MDIFGAAFFNRNNMSANPEDLQNVATGTITLLSVLGSLPALAVAPIVLIFNGLFGIFTPDKKKKKK